MPRKCGRPAKSDEIMNNKQKIIDTTVDLLRARSAADITVRNICASAELSIGTFYHYFRDKDDLLMYFLRETPFESCALEAPLDEIGDRIAELYMRLIDRYREFGLDFMKSFYTAGNRSLSAYLCEVDGGFMPNTVMARSEVELTAAQESGVLSKDANIHEISMDICTIVKGCVLEWCLTDGNMDIETALQRIINGYLWQHLNSSPL